MSTLPDSETSLSRSQPVFSWRVVSLLLGIMTAAAMGRHISGPLSPFLKNDLALTETQIGFVSSAIFLGAIVAGIPGGMAADRFSSRTLNVLAFTLLASCFLALSRIDSYPLVVAVLMLSGISTGLIVPVTDLQVVRRFPPHLRITALGIKQMGSPIGAALAAIVIPAVGLRWGLHTTFVALALITSTGILLTKGLQVGRKEEVHLPRKHSTRRAIRNPRLFLLGAFGFGIEGLPAIITTFLLLYFVGVLEVPVAQASLALATVQVSGALGRAPWAAIGDRWFRHRPSYILAIMLVVASSSVLLLSILSKGTPLAVLFAFSILLGIATWGSFPVTTGLAIEIGGHENVGAASALVATISRMSVVVWPPIFGAIVVRTGSYRIAWVSITLVILALSFGALFFANVVTKSARMTVPLDAQERASCD